MIPKNERWKAVTILLLTILGVLAIWLRPLHLGLDLQGGTSVLLEADGQGRTLGNDTMEQLVGVMERRVNQLGLSEPIVQRRGNNRISIELPGYEDQDAAVQALGKTAMLTMADENGKVIITGADLKDAALSRDQYGRPAVSVTLRPEGSKNFAAFTRANVGRPIVIRLDEEVLSTAIINEPITDGKGQISGNFTVESATELSALLRAGSLPVPVQVVEAHTVGPSLGQASIQQSMRAAIIGLVGTFLFMILIYRGLGVVAALALAIYAILVSGAMMGLGAVLTLPGIAGLVLSIGMAVDGNVLIFERAKEEYKLSGSVIPSLRKGFERAFTAIFDSNATTFLAAAVLFALSVGSVKGFAVTLALGVIASFLTAITASRILSHVLVSGRLKDKPSVLGLTTVFQPRQWNVMRLRKLWFTISGIMLAVALVSVIAQGLNWGLDFAGGTLVDVKVNQTLSLEDIEQYASEAGIQGANIQPGQQSFTLKGRDISKDSVKALVARLNEEGFSAELSRQEFVGPTVGKEVREKALLAILIALIGQAIYLSIRFEWKFAITAAMALAHDVMILIGLFSLLQLEVDSTFLAALLTIVGYSVNDTVVIFDRIRENRKAMRNVNFIDMVDASINQTMSRSFNTGATTIMTLFFLLVMGGSTLKNFALALFVGVLVGTYSSIFLASPIVALWHKVEEKGRKNSAVA